MSSSSAAAHLRPSTVASAALWTARVLFGLSGVFLAAGTAYFTFFAPLEEGGVSGVVDWLVAAWSMAVAVGYLVVAVTLGDGTRRTLWLARGLVIAHIAFGLVKLIGYGETETVGFFAFDLLLLGLLAVGGRSRR